MLTGISADRASSLTDSFPEELVDQIRSLCNFFGAYADTKRFAADGTDRAPTSKNSQAHSPPSEA